MIIAIGILIGLLFVLSFVLFDSMNKVRGLNANCVELNRMLESSMRGATECRKRADELQRKYEDAKLERDRYQQLHESMQVSTADPVPVIVTGNHIRI